jgi:hypothetical protein
MKKVNCWEFKKCGREPEGRNVAELGVCPASIELNLDGAHDGKNAGRACWVVTKTFCEGQVQGPFGQKYSVCVKCDFYKKVKAEEDNRFIFSAVLLRRLGNWPESE